MGKEYEDKALSFQRALLTVHLKEKSWSALDKVRILKKSGLDYKEIADILETTPNSVSVMFAKINKEK